MWCAAKTIWDFCKFSLRPAKSWNFCIVCIICIREFWSTLQNRIRSSANIKWVSLSCWHWGWNLKSLACAMKYNNRERYSMQIANSRGERGSPCLSPLPPLKPPWSWPLMWILKFTEVTHVMTYLVNTAGNLRDSSISFTKSQWMESNALCKSTFKMHLGQMYFLW